MREIKDTKRAEVRIGYDGRVHKHYRGPLARERFENEVRVLKCLEARSCPFVPRLLEAHPEELYIITTNCGQIAPNVGNDKMQQLFLELEKYGIRHDDAFARNITYDSKAGRFCVIDFEFAVDLDTGEGLTLAQAEEQMKSETPKL